VTTATAFDTLAIRWQCQPGTESLVERLIQLPERTHIKSTKAKEVVRVELNDVTYFIKFYRNHEIPLRPLKFYFKSSQARQEWETALALESLQIPIVKHIALGERWSRTGLQESILITEGFDGLSLRYSSHWDPIQLGAFLDRLLDAGVLHGDLHPSNILAHRETAEFRLVDLYQIAIKESLSEEEKQHSKAILAMHLPIPVSRTTFLLSRQLRWKAVQKRARRCLRENQDFGTIRIGDRTWQVSKALIQDPIKARFNQLDEAFQSAPNLLKDGRSSTVTRLPEGAVLKRYNFKKRLNYIKDFFRLSRGKRSFLNAYHLEIVDIPTARGIATADIRKATGARQSYFAMEDLSQAVHLLDWQGDRHTLIQATAQLIAHLHNEAFSHRDLKATNIMLDPDGTAYLIDLDGLEFKGTLPPIKLVASDLRRLYHDGEKHLAAQPSEKRAFLRTYLRARDVTPYGLKTIVKTWQY
jgi:tRNA A-37 threonylcarbamoyl transferase component Bud32